MRFLLIFALFAVAVVGQTVPALPEKAAKYHSMLLKRPKPGAIFDRFESAWLEDGDIASLRAFLQSRAELSTADRLLLGFFLSQQNESDAALSVFAKALEADPDNADAWLLRAQAEARMARHEDALKSLEHLKDSAGEAGVIAAKLKAQTLVRLGRTEDALTTLKQLAQAHPDDEDLQDEVIEMQLDEGLQGEAVESLKALIERTKDAYQRVLRRLRLGDIHKRLGNREEALASYAQCLEDAAQDSWVETEVLAQIEQTFRSKDELTGLRAHLEKLAEKHGRRLALGQLRARVLADLNEGDEAVKLHRELVQKHPGNGALKEAFIDLLARHLKYDDAVTQCGELLAQRPKDKELRIHYATLLYQAKRPGEALHALDPLIAEPKTPEFELLRVARLYESFEDPVAAKKLYQKTADLYPDNAGVQDALASFLHAHGSKPFAVSIWQKQAKAPAGRDDVLRVARALGSRGESDAALEVLQDREPEFARDAGYLAQAIAAAGAARRAELAKPWTLALISMAKDGDSLFDALRQVRPVMRDERVAQELIKELKAKTSLTVNERCLLADLLEQTGDPAGADKTLAGEDAIQLRMQAQLYLMRQDFEKAALTLEKALTSKRELSVIEQLATLYQRASNYDAALKWIGEWRLLLPSSVRPYLAEARVLQMQSKMEEAVTVLKQAARKITDDVSLKTALADACYANGQTADAQRIYQALYDEAQDTAEQIRWAGQLAEMAQRRGTLKELLDAFQERQRSNRASVAPWLAIAEIHRRTNSYEGRRNALLEAARLKPKDVDLLHQIARVDEDQGEWRKALDSLTTAAAIDRTTKTKQRIAELQLRYGDEETGMRLAYELNGGNNMDPRDAEGMITGLMTRNNWKGALTVLEPMLNQRPDDYRLRYLKMLCLVEDNQTDAAINEAVTLMGARVEVLTPSVTRNVTAMVANEGAPELDPVSEMAAMIAMQSQAALRYRTDLSQMAQGNRFFFFGTPGDKQMLYFMPQQVQAVKPMVTSVLVQMRTEQEWDKTKIAEVTKRLAVAGHPLADALAWFDIGEPGQGLHLSRSAVKQHLDNEKLAKLWITQSQFNNASRMPAAVKLQLQVNGVRVQGDDEEGTKARPGKSPDEELLQQVYEHYKTKSPDTAALAMLNLWQFDRTNEQAVDQVAALAPSISVRDYETVYHSTMALLRGFDADDLKKAPALKLRDVAVQLIKRYVAAHPAETSRLMEIPNLHAAVGDWKSFVASLEEGLAAQASKTFRSSFYSTGSVRVQMYDIQFVLRCIKCLPYEITSRLLVSRNPRMDGGRERFTDAEKKELLAAAKTMKDPELRALMAYACGDAATFDAFANAQAKAEKPLLWPLVVRARGAAVPDPVKSAEWLMRARKATTEREVLAGIDAALVHEVGLIMKSGKKEAAGPFRKDAEAAVLSLRRVAATGSSYDMEQVAQAMENLGMAEEAARQRKLVASARQSQQGVYRSGVSASSADPAQLEKDIRAGKLASALPQVVRGLKQAAATAAGNQSGNGWYELRRWAPIAKSKLADEVWKQVSAGDTPTLKSKLERAMLAELFGKRDLALSLYEEAVRVLPGDPLVRWQLALAAARAGERDKALAHLMAVPTHSLGNIGSNSLYDSDGWPAGELIAIAAVLTDYILKAKASAVVGDLNWCDRVADLLITSTTRSKGPSLPNLLQEEISVSGEAKTLHDERVQVFRRYCDAAADIPELARHVLPAQYALAVQAKEDTKPLIERAHAVLASLATRRSMAPYWNGDDGSESYNGSWSGKKLFAPQLPAMLFMNAKDAGTLDDFNQKTVPQIRAVYGAGAGTDYAFQAKLLRCEASEFATLAAQYAEDRKRNGGSFSPTPVFRLAAERKLDCDLRPIFTSFLREQSRLNYGIDSNCLDAYAQAFAFRRATMDIQSEFKAIAEAALDKPEAEWAAFIAKHGKSSGGFSPQRSKISTMLATIAGLGRQNFAWWIEGMMFVRDLKMEPDEYKSRFASAFPSKNLPHDSSEMLPALERSCFLADMNEFDAIGKISTAKGTSSFLFDNVMDILRPKGVEWAGPLIDALVERQKTKPSFGAAMVIGKLAVISPDMKLTLERCADDFIALPPERQQAVLSLIRSVWRDFDKAAKKPENQSLKGYVLGGQNATLAQVKQWMDAKRLNEVAEPSSRAVSAAVLLAAGLMESDGLKAEQFLRKAITLIDEACARGEWTTQYGNGYNAQTDLLMQFGAENIAVQRRGKGAPSLLMLPMMTRLCCRPDNKTAAFPEPQSRSNWGWLIRLWTERADGHANPRKATRELIEAVTKAMGDEDLRTLWLPFYDYALQMPVWYQAIIRDEATSLASGSKVAEMLALAFAFANHEERGLDRARALAADATLHPLYRSNAAMWLAREVSANMSIGDAKICMEAIIGPLENDGPAFGNTWELTLPAFNRMPDSPEWQALAASFRKAWMHRARLYSGKSAARLFPYNQTLFQAVELFARSAPETELRAFTKVFGESFNAQAQSCLYFARWNRAESLKDVLFSGDRHDHEADNKSDGFREGDDAALKNVNQATDDPSLALLARVYVASTRDSAVRPPTKRIGERLADEARALIAMKEVKSEVAEEVRPMLGVELDAARVLAPSWLKEHLLVDQLTALASKGGDFRAALERLIPYVAARLCDGDEKTWEQFVKGITAAQLRRKEATGKGNELLQTLSYELATHLVKHVNAHGYENSAWTWRAARDVIDAVAGDEFDADVHELVEFWLAHGLVTGEMTAFDVWRNGLDKKAAKRFTPNDFGWMSYVLATLPLTKGEDGGKTLLAILNDPWARKIVAGGGGDLSYRKILPARFGPAMLLPHTKELLASAIDHKPTILSLINTWAEEKDKTVLFGAMKSIQPKLKNKDCIDYAKTVELEAGRVTPR